jgi:hypothetical protein
MTTHVHGDGTTRQNHYGQGEQPWDAIKTVGWGPEFAAGNVIKYLRRTKDIEHSIESARWYWARLHEDTYSYEQNRRLPSVLYKLEQMLTPDEFNKLR